MGLITTENAREMAAKANAAIAARKEAARVAVEIAVSSPELDFAERTLTRVRLQMDRLSTEIDREITCDSKRLKELTDAYSRLADQERILAGRPMPGSRRPAQDKPTTDPALMSCGHNNTLAAPVRRLAHPSLRHRMTRAGAALHCYDNHQQDQHRPGDG